MGNAQRRLFSKVFNLREFAVIINPGLDNVAVAKKDIPKNTCFRYGAGLIRIKDLIKKGERFALRSIKRGEYIRQYGYPFGQSMGIREGVLINIRNVRNTLPQVRIKNYRSPPPTRLIRKYLDMTFLGYNRKDNKAGTRNYYLVVPTSMCASETALQAASALERDKGLMRKYTSIDGVVAIPHTEGCGCDSGMQIERLLLVLRGYISHPNVGGCLIIDLGCEQTNYDRMYGYLRGELAKGLKPIDWITIQNNGGTGRTLGEAAAIIKKRLKEVACVKREAVPIAKLVAGTECGASDSFSGISANPIIGSAVDKIIFGGGSAILAEATEMAGTFAMLLPRFRNLGIGYKFKHILDWYTDIARRLGLTLEPNLVPKNIEGGLINNYIKSLGAVMKGGTTVIEDVIDYAQPLRKRGLNLAQGPGNDPESVTGIVASGANIICFSTGKGTITGDAICPVIKIASNEDTFKKLPYDMDFDGSRLFKGNRDTDSLGEELLNKIIRVASGEKTWSEKWKQRQFQVWTAGKLSL